MFKAQKNEFAPPIGPNTLLGRRVLAVDEDLFLSAQCCCCR